MPCFPQVAPLLALDQSREYDSRLGAWQKSHEFLQQVALLTNHNKVNMVFGYRICNGIKVGWADGQIGAKCCGACISGCGK